MNTRRLLSLVLAALITAAQILMFTVETDAVARNQRGQTLHVAALPGTADVA